MNSSFHAEGLELNFSPPLLDVLPLSYDATLIFPVVLFCANFGLIEANYQTIMYQREMYSLKKDVMKKVV